MDVVGHQTPGPNAHARFVRRLGQPVAVGGVVGIGEEHPPPAVAALRHMVGQAGLAPCPQVGRRGDLPQHVRPPDPAAGAERPLDDHFRSRFHRLARPRQGSLMDADALDDGDGEPARFQMLDSALFVTASSLLENLLERFPKFRLPILRESVF